MKTGKVEIIEEVIEETVTTTRIKSPAPAPGRAEHRVILEQLITPEKPPRAQKRAGGVQSEAFALILRLSVLEGRKRTLYLSEGFSILRLILFSALKEESVREELVGRVSLLNRVLSKEPKQKRIPTLREVFFRWVVRTHKEHSRKAIQMIAIPARIKREVAIWRLKHLVNQNRNSKMEKFVRSLEKLDPIISKVRKRHKFSEQNVAFFAVKALAHRVKTENRKKLCFRFAGVVNAAISRVFFDTENVALQSRPQKYLANKIVTSMQKKASLVFRKFLLANRKVRILAAARVTMIIHSAISKLAKSMMTSAVSPLDRLAAIYSRNRRTAIKKRFTQLLTKVRMMGSLPQSLACLVGKIESIHRHRSLFKAFKLIRNYRRSPAELKINSLSATLRLIDTFSRRSEAHRFFQELKELKKESVSSSSDSSLSSPSSVHRSKAISFFFARLSKAGQNKKFESFTHIRDFARNKARAQKKALLRLFSGFAVKKRQIFNRFEALIREKRPSISDRPAILKLFRLFQKTKKDAFSMIVIRSNVFSTLEQLKLKRQQLLEEVQFEKSKVSFESPEIAVRQIEASKAKLARLLADFESFSRQKEDSNKSFAEEMNKKQELETRRSMVLTDSEFLSAQLLQQKVNHQKFQQEMSGSSDRVRRSVVEDKLGAVTAKFALIQENLNNNSRVIEETERQIKSLDKSIGRKSKFLENSEATQISIQTAIMKEREQLARLEERHTANLKAIQEDNLKSEMRFAKQIGHYKLIVLISAEIHRLESNFLISRVSVTRTITFGERKISDQNRTKLQDLQIQSSGLPPKPKRHPLQIFEIFSLLHQKVDFQARKAAEETEKENLRIRIAYMNQISDETDRMVQPQPKAKPFLKLQWLGNIIRNLKGPSSSLGFQIILTLMQRREGQFTSLFFNSLKLLSERRRAQRVGLSTISRLIHSKNKDSFLRFRFISESLAWQALSLKNLDHEDKNQLVSAKRLISVIHKVLMKRKAKGFHQIACVSSLNKVVRRVSALMPVAIIYSRHLKSRVDEYFKRWVAARGENKWFSLIPFLIAKNTAPNNQISLWQLKRFSKTKVPANPMELKLLKLQSLVSKIKSANLMKGFFGIQLFLQSRREVETIYFTERASDAYASSTHEMIQIAMNEKKKASCRFIIHSFKELAMKVLHKLKKNSFSQQTSSIRSIFESENNDLINSNRTELKRWNSVLEILQSENLKLQQEIDFKNETIVDMEDTIEELKDDNSILQNHIINEKLRIIDRMIQKRARVHMKELFDEQKRFFGQF